MAIQLTPHEYTAYEGGDWLRWPKDKKFKMEWLKLSDRYSVDMDGLIVHSLAFDSPAMGTGNFPRWDCYTGWTTPISRCEGIGLFTYLTTDGLNRMGRERIIDASR